MVKIREVEGDETTERLDLLQQIQDTAGRVRESKTRVEQYKAALKAAKETYDADALDLEKLTGVTAEALPLFDGGEEE